MKTPARAGVFCTRASHGRVTGLPAEAVSGSPASSGDRRAGDPPVDHGEELVEAVAVHEIVRDEQCGGVAFAGEP